MADKPYPVGGEVAAKDAARAAFESSHVECDALATFRLTERENIAAAIANLEAELAAKTMALAEIKLDQPSQASRCLPNAVKMYGKWWTPK